MPATDLRMRAAVFAKQANPTDPAVQSVLAQGNAQLQSSALHDIGNLGLAGLGAGAGVAGVAGLLNLLKQNRAKKTRSGPALLPLPYPVDPIKQANAWEGLKSFMGGQDASTKAGIPWYGPGMLGAGLAGAGLGYKGVSGVMAHQRRKETEQELAQVRQDFHDALLAQYDRPIGAPAQAKAASSRPLVEAGAELDRVFDQLTVVKQAFDYANAGGAALGGYGMYAGLSGLLTGSLVYDKMRKRQQRAVIEKALQRRQRRNFSQQPTEIYAVPEPVSSLPPKPSMGAEMKLLNEPPEGLEG